MRSIKIRFDGAPPGQFADHRWVELMVNWNNTFLGPWHSIATGTSGPYPDVIDSSAPFWAIVQVPLGSWVEAQGYDEVGAAKSWGCTTSAITVHFYDLDNWGAELPSTLAPGVEEGVNCHVEVPTSS